MTNNNIKAMAARQNIDENLIRDLPEHAYNDASVINHINKLMTEQADIDEVKEIERHEELFEVERDLDRITKEREQLNEIVEYTIKEIMTLINKKGAVTKHDLKRVIEDNFPNNIMPESFDNGGETIDRYTVRNAWYGSNEALVCSGSPEYATGVSTIMNVPYALADKEVSFWDLPLAVQHHYISRFGVPLED